MPSLQLKPDQMIASENLRDTSEDQPNMAESSVTCIYQAMLVNCLRNVIITWSKASTTHSLTITIENLYDDDHQTCHIDFQPGQVWSKKGRRSLNIDESERVDIFWDFKAVKFSSNPEPSSNYYVAIVFDKQMVLLLGDSKADAYKRTMAKPAPVAPTLTHKEEVLYGNSAFYTQVCLDDGPEKHDIVIENSSKRPNEPELRISIDGRVVVRVMHLDWRFRGNETVLVNNIPVQVFWDVHDWLFNGKPGSGHGLFIFKPGSLQNILDNDSRKDDRKDGNRKDDSKDGDKEDHDKEDNVTSAASANCCHFVFAVKVV